ncbi:unnamed protein product [Ambrosiozyma monospora]|uniref:Unnamed protein product n=1 Tax=Ambrosiozyma monospora TaxID=43982 RepID=A0A9W7DEZ4_AMBMO|nr:unnamed protein product [Ambrosiozyma monospora]
MQFSNIIAFVAISSVALAGHSSSAVASSSNSTKNGSAAASSSAVSTAGANINNYGSVALGAGLAAAFALF